MGKPKLLLLSHGGLAVEIHKVLIQFTGEQENVTSFRMDESLGGEGVKKDLESYLAANKGELIIITDIYGGSPFNVAVKFLSENKNIRLITGLNLAMLLEYSFSKHQTLEDVVKGIIEAGTEAVKSLSFTEFLSKPTDPDDEDEIQID